MYLIVTNVVLFCTCPALSYATSVSFAIIIRIRQRPGIRGLKTRVPTGIYIEKCCVINMAISHTHSLDTAILHSD